MLTYELILFSKENEESSMFVDFESKQDLEIYMRKLLDGHILNTYVGGINTTYTALYKKGHITMIVAKEVKE